MICASRSCHKIVKGPGHKRYCSDKCQRLEWARLNRSATTSTMHRAVSTPSALAHLVLIPCPECGVRGPRRLLVAHMLSDHGVAI